MVAGRWLLVETSVDSNPVVAIDFFEVVFAVPLESDRLKQPTHRLHRFFLVFNPWEMWHTFVHQSVRLWVVV